MVGDGLGGRYCWKVKAMVTVRRQCLGYWRCGSMMFMAAVARAWTIRSLDADSTDISLKLHLLTKVNFHN